MVTGDIDADSDAISNNGIYTFSVMAKEVVPPDNPFPQMNIGFPFNITTAVSVTVHDVNDNGPIFYETAVDGTNIPETTFSTSIDENTSDFIAVPGLSIYVKDKDKGANAAFTLRTNSPAFEVVPAQVNGEAAVNLRVKDSTLLDFESTQHFMVEITATEDSATKNFSATATVHIDITDINDNSPEFVNDTFVTTVPENVTNGFIVALVQATDKDTGSFGEITYSIVSLTPSVDFAIDNRTGEVTVASTLDRERN
uniref:Cadherin domain-containing protein n=1 Tax=Ciona savignyi TaxID=51511 RepID=H2YBR0_CIOSA